MPLKDGLIEYEFEGELPKEQVRLLANKFGYPIYRLKAEGGKTLVTSKEVMPRELRNYIVEISEFETLGPNVKGYLTNRGLKPCSRIIAKDPWERYERYKGDISGICDWDSEMGHGQDTYDKAIRVICRILGIDNYSNVENPVIG